MALDFHRSLRLASLQGVVWLVGFIIGQPAILVLENGAQSSNKDPQVFQGQCVV